MTAAGQDPNTLIATGSGKQVQVELTSAQTALPSLHQATNYKVTATLTNGDAVTLVEGTLAVSP